MSRTEPNLILFELDRQNHSDALELLQLSRARFGFTPIAIFVEFEPAVVASALGVARTGIASHVVLTRSSDAEHLTRQLLISARFNSVERMLISVGDQYGTARTRSFLRFIATKSTQVLSVTDIADHFGVDRKTVSANFRKDDLQTPHVVIWWNRLLHAVHAIERSTRTFADIAADLGFSSASDMSHQFRRYFGDVPTSYRAPNSFQRALEAYAELLKSTAGSSGRS